MAALEHALREAQVESGRLREERERREETLTGAVESLKQQLEEVGREKEQVQKELEQLTQESKDSFAKMEVRLHPQHTPSAMTCIRFSVFPPEIGFNQQPDSTVNLTPVPSISISTNLSCIFFVRFLKNP